MNIYKETKGDLIILTADGLDVNQDLADRVYLKNLVSKLFSVGDEVFFLLRNEEYFANKSELQVLKERVFKTFQESGKLIFLDKLDEKRFYAIAMIKYDLNTPDFIIDLWKYFMGCTFFKPINELTFEEYEDYLECNGDGDECGLKQLWNKLSNFISIKGVGGDYLLISYNALELDLENTLQPEVAK